MSKLASFAFVFTVVLTLVFPGLASAAAAAVSPPASQAPGTEAGRKVIQLPVTDDPTISFSISWRAGSQDDPPGREGLAALTGALIAQGSTQANSYQTILEKLYPLASSYTVRVDKELTTLTGRTHRDNLETFFRLFTEAYLKPAFLQTDFDRLLSNQRNALENDLRYAQDEVLAKAALTSFVFAGSRYAHPLEGTSAGLSTLNVGDVRAFYNKYYRAENATLALGGGYPPTLVDRLAATLIELPRGPATQPPAIVAPPIEGWQALLVAKPGADASISLGFPIAARRGERDFYALWLANSWLGEHRNSSSHLYGVIREARGLNYGDYSYVEAFPEGHFLQMPPTGVARRHQMFEVWIRTLPNENAVFAIRAALREIRRLIDQGLSEQEFKLTRAFLSKYVLNFATNTETRLGYRVDDAFYGVGGEGHLARFREIVPTLTREEVNAAIKKYLQLERLKLAIVTGEAEKLRQVLTTNAPSPITYPTEKSPAILAEDKEIAAYPLTFAEGAVQIVPIEEIFSK